MPNIPSDSLYKFLAVGSTVLLILTVLFLYRRAEQLEAAEIEIIVALIETGGVEAAASSATTLPADPSMAAKAVQRELIRRQGQGLLDALDGPFGWFLWALSALCGISYGLWWSKSQRWHDQLLRAEAKTVRSRPKAIVSRLPERRNSR